MGTGNGYTTLDIAKDKGDATILALLPWRITPCYTWLHFCTVR